MNWEPIQLDYREDPWKVLVVCILLNQVRGERVRPIVSELFSKYPTPERMAQAEESDLSQIVRPLGFHNRRARILIKFSSQWIEKPEWRKYSQDLKRFCGVGDYAVEAWRIIIIQDFEFPANDWALEAWRKKQLTGRVPV